MKIEESHISREGFERLVATDLEEEARRALLHGIANCPGCRPVVGRVFELLESGALSPEFGIVDLSLAESRDAAPELFRELLAAPDRQRLLRQKRFRSWGLCERLIRASLDLQEEGAAESLELARVAVDLADWLIEDEPCERAWLLQLRGLARAALAEAQRRRGDRGGARRTLEAAKQLWEEGEEEAGDVLGFAREMAELAARLER
jgi:hypothetical protein